jgi:predicted outer membrane repeat protein
VGLLLSAALLGAVSANIWVVDQGGGGDFSMIQPAILAAATGDEIVVHPGTYVENINFLSKDLNVHSSEGAATTTIDGSAGAPGMGSCATLSSGLTSTAVLASFTLTGGHGTLYREPLDDLPRDTMVGGAIYCLNGNPRITQCFFQANIADYAAGIFLDGADAEIAECIFEGNYAATYGGGIAGPNSAPNVHDCVFEDNHAASGDGTIHVQLPAVIERCVFRGNHARAGAGVNSPNYGANFRVRDCIFEGNSSDGNHGGAIRVHEATLVIDGCLFVGNHAAEDGGAILCIDGGATQVRNCTFWGNGAARNGGTIAVWYGAAPILTNNIIAAATQAGGVFCSSGDPTFSCNDAWANLGGDYVGCPDPTGSGGNISQDPRLCDPENGDFHLAADSPCASQNNPECGQIGLYPVACGPTPVAERSWGALKSMFRLMPR